jgi:hypothetical protein
MATGTGVGGATIDVNDEVTISGTVTVIGGTTPTSLITVQGISSGTTFSVQRQYLYGPTVSGAGAGINTLKVGDPVTVHTAVVQATTSGAGSTAIHTVVMPNSTTVTSVPAKDITVKKTH